jgi:hypothetical protein
VIGIAACGANRADFGATHGGERAALARGVEVGGGSVRQLRVKSNRSRDAVSECRAVEAPAGARMLVAHIRLGAIADVVECRYGQRCDGAHEGNADCDGEKKSPSKHWNEANKLT